MMCTPQPGEAASLPEPLAVLLEIPYGFRRNHARMEPNMEGGGTLARSALINMQAGVYPMRDGSMRMDRLLKLHL